MRILQVSSASELGGGETHVIQLTQALRARGHDVRIAGRSNGPLAPDLQLPFRNSIDVLTCFRLRSILKHSRFDVMHAHVARDYTIAAAAAWGIERLKVVFTRHLLYPVHSHFLYRRVDGWIAPTASILQVLRPLSPKKSAVIPNWVDVETFAYNPHSPHKPLMIGLVGQISPHKGHDDALDAMRLLGKNFRLLIAGAGDAAYQAKLQSKADGLPVEFVGFVRLPEFFERIDVLVAPSWEEPFGIVLLEAMAAGIPVIATDAGNTRTIVRGVLVPPRNPVALADAIRSLNPASVVRDARAHVEKNFDMRLVIPKIEDFYSSL